MIHFRYRPSPEFNAILKKDIVDYYNDTIAGVMEEGVASNLRYAAAYLVCEMEFIDGININKNPLVVVALNDNGACELYSKATGRVGTIMDLLQSNCAKFKIEIGE